jgi:hypothetical protein
MQSKAATVAEYLASLPTDRRTALLEVRDVILANLVGEFEECMGWGMINFSVPHRVFPAGYHCKPEQPLPFAALASQKHYMSVYVHPLYGEQGTAEGAWFRKAWAKTGKKLDMGKCCIRFRKVEDLALGVLGEAIRRVPLERFVAIYTGMLAQRGAATKKARPAKKK